jgi:hypothetical protein
MACFPACHWRRRTVQWLHTHTHTHTCTTHAAAPRCLFQQTPRRGGGAVTVDGHLAKLNEVLVCFYISFALVLSCAVSQCVSISASSRQLITQCAPHPSTHCDSHWIMLRQHPSMYSPISRTMWLCRAGGGDDRAHAAPSSTQARGGTIWQCSGEPCTCRRGSGSRTGA